MPPSILGIGVPATSKLCPDEIREKLRASLETMESDMRSSPYEWEMMYIEPDVDFNIIEEKLRVKDWDVIMIGMGVRTVPAMAELFERIVNAGHLLLPHARFAFPASVETTRAACERALQPRK